MKNIEQTKLYESFDNEVLIQGRFFAYDTLVKWLHRNNIKEFRFNTKTEKYLFTSNEEGVYIYTHTVEHYKLVRKQFLSFKEYLPEKSYYQAPLNLKIENEEN